MPKRHILPIFLATIMLILANVTVVGAQGPPSQPSSFWGTVTVNGANVADGTQVTAWINGTQQAQAATQTWNGASVYSIAVPNGNDGDTIEFQVSGQVATQNGSWQTGINTELNLTVGGPITPTVTPTVTVPITPTVTPTPSDSNVVIPLISAGDLSVGWDSVIFPQTSLAGLDVLAYAIDQTWTVSDTTNLGAGWHVTVIADDHLRGEGDPANRVINVGSSHDFKVSCLDGETSTVSGDSVNLPSCSVGAQPVPLVGESPLTMLSANAGDGMGTYNFIPHFQLLVPGTTIIDTYRTNIYVDAIAGP